MAEISYTYMYMSGKKFMHKHTPISLNYCSIIIPLYLTIFVCIHTKKVIKVEFMVAYYTYMHVTCTFCEWDIMVLLVVFKSLHLE